MIALIKEEVISRKHPLPAPAVTRRRRVGPPTAGPVSNPSRVPVLGPRWNYTSLKRGGVWWFRSRGTLSSCLEHATHTSGCFFFCLFGFFFSPSKPTLFLRVLGLPCPDSFNFRMSYIPVSILHACGIQILNNEINTCHSPPLATTTKEPG